MVCFLSVRPANQHTRLLQQLARTDIPFEKRETNPTWDMMSVFVIATNYNSVQFLKVAMIQNTSRHTSPVTRTHGQMKCFHYAVYCPPCGVAIDISMIIEDTQGSTLLQIYFHTCWVRCLQFLPALSLFALLLSANVSRGRNVVLML